MADNAGEPEDLFERLKRGDNQAVAEFFSLHRERLWQIVRFRLDRRLASRVDVDDVLQEVYLDATRRLRHYVEDPSVSFFVWLRTIVGQTMIDLHRRHLGTEMRDANREVSIHGARYPQATSVSLVIQLMADITSPSRVAVRKELTNEVEQAIEGMDPIDREVLALRHFEELTNSEVSEVLDITQSAASVRYMRAIARLKRILAEVPDFLD
jgi:RNA polymerase sigma-70 factor (ECF subfamily)